MIKKWVKNIEIYNISTYISTIKYRMFIFYGFNDTHKWQWQIRLQCNQLNVFQRKQYIYIEVPVTAIIFPQCIHDYSRKESLRTKCKYCYWWTVLITVFFLEIHALTDASFHGYIDLLCLYLIQRRSLIFRRLPMFQGSFYSLNVIPRIQHG